MANGRVRWHVDAVTRETIQTAQLPKEILQCRSVVREIVFSSSKALEHLSMEQRVYFKGECIEQWDFWFGFVIPQSTNTWQNEIQASNDMLGYTELSGNLVIETRFKDGDRVLTVSIVRVYYV